MLSTENIQYTAHTLATHKDWDLKYFSRANTKIENFISFVTQGSVENSLMCWKCVLGCVRSTGRRHYEKMHLGQGYEKAVGNSVHSQ